VPTLNASTGPWLIGFAVRTNLPCKIYHQFYGQAFCKSAQTLTHQMAVYPDTLQTLKNTEDMDCLESVEMFLYHRYPIVPYPETVLNR
jgi:hypothetical protein